MRDNKLHTPDGVRDYLPEEYFFKVETQRRIESVFNRYGYLPLSSPMFEYVEVFEGKGSVSSSNLYKFLDRDGTILSLRSDMTPAIARIAATAYKAEDMPLRFCYFENAFRYNESYQGKLKEFTQAGVELIGVNSDDASAEVIALAVNSLIATGLEEFRVDIGQVQFFKGVVEESGLDEETCMAMQKHIVESDYVAVEKMVQGKQIPKGIRTILSELPLLIGGKEVIERARGLTKNATALYALDNLENIYDILCGYGVEKYISFDLSMLGHLDYYTGIIFRGYAHGAGLSIVGGGRYDNLLSKFGTDYPSVGFAIKLSVLMSVLEGVGFKANIEKPDTLLAYTEKGRNVALSTADELRQNGLFIENSLVGNDIDENIAYAKKRNFGGMLFFENDEDIIVVDLHLDTRKNIKISELLNS